MLRCKKDRKSDGINVGGVRAYFKPHISNTMGIVVVGMDFWDS